MTFLDKYLSLPPVHSSLPALALNITIHYSFDFAQQVSTLELVTFIQCDFFLLSFKKKIKTVIVGAFSSRSSATWSSVFLDSKEMWYFLGSTVKPFLARYALQKKNLW